jgi:hypothetical protein
MGVVGAVDSAVTSATDVEVDVDVDFDEAADGDDGEPCCTGAPQPVTVQSRRIEAREACREHRMLTSTPPGFERFPRACHTS